MPNLREKTWTSTTPANVEDAQFWEDHLISNEDASKLENITGVPDGGSSGQVLTRTTSGIGWRDPASSGHTIQNAAGVDMPYQGTLQFLGADVANDSENDKTVVDCHGEKGDAATIAAGTVTMLPAGSTPTVTNSGTSSAAIFDFGIPSSDGGVQSLIKDTVGWTGKNRAYSQTNNAVIAHIENGITYDVSWTGSATVTLKKNSASGATITSGSTSPLSFTADADYELYFGSSATVTNIMVKDSRITDPTYESYHESVEQTLRDAEVIEGKNLIDLNKTSSMNSNVQVTLVNHGLKIETIASATYGASKTLLDGLIVGGRYVVSFTVISSDNANCKATIRDASNNIKAASRYGTSTGRFNFEFEYVAGDYFSVLITDSPASSGSTTLDNIMLCTKEEWNKSQDFEPYYIPLKESKVDWTSQGVLGAKNLFKVTVNTQTVNGVTFTVNRDSDGNVINVTANGTATANTSFRLIPFEDINLDLWTGKPLRLSGCPSGGSGDTYALEIYYNDGQGHWLRDFGNGAEFSIPVSGLTGINPNIMVKNGVTVNNLVFKPMLHLASDPDDTYQPYAMTNRELTENTFLKQGDISSSNDLNNIKEDGIYAITTAPIHSPENTAYYILIVKKYAENQLIQVIHKHDVMYSRRYFNNSGSFEWSSWYKFTGTAVS